jgi:hypothetical protein
MKRKWTPMKFVRPGKAFWYDRTKYFRLTGQMLISKQFVNLVNTSGELGFLDGDIAVKIQCK